MDDARLLNEQIEYYRARATEYDEWAFRQGRYDRGPEHRAAWLAERDWTGWVRSTGRFFLYGSVTPSSAE